MVRPRLEPFSTTGLLHKTSLLLEIGVNMLFTWKYSVYNACHRPLASCPSKVCESALAVGVGGAGLEVGMELFTVIFEENSRDARMNFQSHCV